MHKLLPTVITIFMLIFCLNFPAPAESALAGPEQTAERLQARIDTIKSLSFNFYQQTRGELTGRPKKGSGKAVFLKNNGRGLMRWDYTSPDRQVLISDGQVFSMYFENLHQMIVTPAEKLKSDLTYSFFIGNSRLMDDFIILPPDPDIGGSTEGMSVIKLIPKIPHARIESIHLWVTDDSVIRRITLLDHFGTETVLSFSDIKIDPLNEMDGKAIRKIFSFSPPRYFLYFLLKRLPFFLILLFRLLAYLLVFLLLK